MSRIVVLGAGVCGLTSAMMLARDGHDVLVLERDTAAPPDTPDEAWTTWERQGVTQFRLAHFLLPAGRAMLEAELPEAITSLSAAGAARVDQLASLPPTIADGTPRPGDDRFVTVTARRPLLEQVLSRLAQHHEALEVRRGVTVAGLTSKPRGARAHITGVCAESGDQIPADLVVDVTGRRSRLPQWLRQLGTRPVHEESEHSGFSYYQRTFRSSDGTLPRIIAPIGSPIGTIFLVTLPADNGTWAVVIATSSGDKPLKRLRDPQVWTSVVRACPLHAHWLDGQPITGVEAMGGLIDRCRRFARGEDPVATGIAAVADAWACTNPSLGRGITYGLHHAQRLRDTVREHLQDPDAFAHAWDEVTETDLRPFYDETIAENRLRRDQIDALRHGLEAPTADRRTARFLAAVPHDPDVFRAFLETRAGITTMGEVLSRSALTERIDQLAIPAPMPLPGPNRTQLLELVAEGATDKPHHARSRVDHARPHRNGGQRAEEATERNDAELVRRYFDLVWNRGELAAVDEFFGEEFTNFGHHSTDARALIRRIVAVWRMAFPDLHFEIEEEIVQRDAVVHRVTCSGTHLGRFEHPAIGVLEPSGRAFSVDQMHITRVRDGRIVAHWGTRNDLAMLQQLGAVAGPPVTGSMTSSAG